ncbi:MAG: sigma-70 family RNA polymerase sigma factor [Pirellulaceae bacterium]
MNHSGTAGRSPSGAAEDPRMPRPPTKWIGEVFARLELPLLSYARRQLGSNQAAAGDVVQEAFVRLCQQRWPEIESHATAWLYRTCRNRAIDLNRREGRMNSTTSDTDVSTLHDRSRQPPETLERDEQLSILRSHLTQLSDRQQEVLRLRLHDNLSYKQIAEIMGLTSTNVGFILHQAIATLRAGLS